MRLYELAEAYASLRDLLFDADDGPDDGERAAAMEARLSALTDSLEDKVEGIALLIRELEAESLALKTEADKMSARRGALEAKRGRLATYLFDNLKASDVMSVDRPRISVRLQLNNPAVVFDDGAEEALPAEYVTEKTTTKPDKRAIMDALKNGIDVPGCRIERSLGLRIR